MRRMDLKVLEIVAFEACDTFLLEYLEPKDAHIVFCGLDEDFQTDMVEALKEKYEEGEPARSCQRRDSPAEKFDRTPRHLRMKRLTWGLLAIHDVSR